MQLGRGGREHKYLQQLLKQVGEDRGFRATIEQQITGGAGSVDISLERDGKRIACEISVTSTSEQELGNVRKCLAAEYTGRLRYRENCRAQRSLRGPSGIATDF
jgi:hypothetical protein